MNDEDNVIDKFSDLFEQIVTENQFERKHLEAMKQQADSIFFSAQAKNKPKEWMNFSHLLTGYIYLLETGCDADEAFEHIKTTFDKTQEFIDNNKHRNNWYVKQTVKSADKHLKQRRMIREGSLDRSVLTSAGTPSKQYKRLSRQVKLHDAMVAMKEANEKLTSDLLQKSGEAAVAHKKLSDNQINEILESEQFETMPLKEKAKILDKVGWNKTEIAEALGKNRKTITRWLGENNV